MALTLKWTKTAERDLSNMVDFIKTNVSPSKLALFLDQVFLTLDLLAEFPPPKSLF
jgi:plasmid stabilization system protein ParE